MSRMAWLSVCCLLACQTPPEETPVPAARVLPPIEAPYPDLRGRWTTVVKAIYSGDEGPHDFPVRTQPINVASLHFAIEIEFQDGPLFYGTVKSTGEVERMLGAIRSDGREAVYTTSLGHGVFRIRSADEMESCATRGTPRSLLATCNVLKREPEARAE